MTLESKFKPLNLLWHDSSNLFLSTIEPAIGEDITVYLRTLKDNATYAFVEYSSDKLNYHAVPLSLDHTDKSGHYDYWKGIIPGQTELFKYRFRVGNEDPNNEVYYTRTRIGKEPLTFDEKSLDPDDLWTLIPGFKTPDWAKGVSWYSIMPDAFYNGDLTNDEVCSGDNLSNSWNKVQHTLQYKYGGDLKGIQKKLQYIKDLGCEAIAMNPIHKATQNAGYGTEHFHQVEHSFGNAKSLVDLANAVHENDMHYLMDVVLTFVPLNDIWFNAQNGNPHPGAGQDPDSPYHDFFWFDGAEGDLSAFRPKWGGVELNLANELLCQKLYKNKDSYLQRYISEPFSADALRYDCGGWMHGEKPDGTIIKSDDVIGDMRPYLKDINPELLLLTEYSMYYSVDKGIWDSRWNLQFPLYAEKYIRGQISESMLAERVDNEMLNLPRNFALCQYTSLADHDHPRPHNIEKWAFKALELVQMTSVGSPCLYYGDEVKLERESGTFYAMEWDESAWDYEVLNDTKAILELRKKNSALKLGASKKLLVDDDRHLFLFARKDEENTCITCANRNAFSQTVSIDTYDLEEPDGTIFTDWFTGMQYVSQNGKITVSVLPGGTIIVKGRHSSARKAGYEVLNIGDASAEVVAPMHKALRITGTGCLSKADSLTLAHTHLFNDCRIAASVEPTGNGLMMLRADGSADAPFVAAEVSDQEIIVHVRRTKGDAIETIRRTARNAISEIEIARDATNNITITTGQLAGISKEIIADNLRLDLPNHILAGFSVLNGSCTFENIVTVYNQTPIFCDDFTYGYSAMFDPSEHAILNYKDDNLELSAGSEVSEVLTNAFSEDWTFKSRLLPANSNSGDYCGIISRQDEACGVVAGRMRTNEDAVFFIGRMDDGKLTVHHTIPDTAPDCDATIQLQRIGTAYSAVMSYDETHFESIGFPVIANLCKERVGLTVSANNSAVYLYASFGNAIYDKYSFNTPITPDEIQIDYELMDEAVKMPKYRIVSGEWDYADEGYVQKSADGGQLSIMNKRMKGVKADGTYLFDKAGTITIEFGKVSYDTPLGDGVALTLSSDGTLTLTKDETVYYKGDIEIGVGTALRICAEYRNGTLVLYTGQDGTPLTVLRNFEIPMGYIAYHTSGDGAHVNNAQIASMDAPIYFAAKYEKLGFEDNQIHKRWNHTTGFVNHFGVAVTNFTASATFKPSFVPALPNSCVGFYICTPEGKLADAEPLGTLRDKRGLLYGLDKETPVFTDRYTLCGTGALPITPYMGIAILVKPNGQLIIKNGDIFLAYGSVGKIGDEGVTLKVTKRGGQISVFVNGSDEPAAKCQLTIDNGGTVALYAENAAMDVSDFIIKDMTNERN